jgi:hypothetical protein
MPREKSIDITQEKMLEHVKDGMSDKQIADMYYVSESTIQRIRRELGVARYAFTYDRWQYLRMREIGIHDDMIAYIFGVSKRSLMRWKLRAGLTRKYTKRNVSNDSR